MVPTSHHHLGKERFRRRRLGRRRACRRILDSTASQQAHVMPYVPRPLLHIDTRQGVGASELHMELHACEHSRIGPRGERSPIYGSRENDRSIGVRLYRVMVTCRLLFWHWKGCLKLEVPGSNTNRWELENSWKWRRNLPTRR